MMMTLAVVLVGFVMQTMVLEEFPVGEVVFLQGDIGNKFYIILKGSIDVRAATYSHLRAAYGKPA